MRAESTTCCIAGGGPAGMMLGFLLARAGVDVVVLEKHADFLRDFRGDTIHPSTLQVMHELGLLDEFLTLPHRKEPYLAARFHDQTVRVVDFSHLPVRCGFIALMPQWDFLDFLADAGRSYPRFRLIMNAKADRLIEENGRVVGAEAETPTGRLAIRADLTVAADGRRSDLRAESGLAVTELGAPMDVLWFRLSRAPSDADQTMALVGAGALFVMLNRNDYWQCAYVIPKGSYEALKAAGIEAFRATIIRFAPELADRAPEIAGWDDVKLLTVAVDRLGRWWKPGFLCIGDAAHAMSPIGGVGVNLAVQDAVAAANRLAGPLRENRLTDDDLAAVQKRRMWPTRATQGIQVAIQKRAIASVLASREAIRAPWLIRLVGRCPLLQRIPARLLGLGIRPEHIGSELQPARPN